MLKCLICNRKKFSKEVKDYLNVKTKLNKKMQLSKQFGKKIPKRVNF